MKASERRIREGMHIENEIRVSEGCSKRTTQRAWRGRERCGRKSERSRKVLEAIEKKREEKGERK